MKDKDKIIEKQSELITYLFIEYGDRFMDDKRYIKHKSELATLKAEEEIHETCDGCQMFHKCGCMLDDSCPECVEHHLWTKKVEQSQTKTAEEILKKIDGIY